MSATAQAFFETLLKTQHLEASSMLIYQRPLLERLLRHARATVPFYRNGRLDVLFDQHDAIRWDRWDEVPVLTRQEAQANAEALYSEHLPPECGSVLSGMTSGSTGRPLAYRTNTLLSAAGTALLERGFHWAELSPDLTIAWIKYDTKNEAAFPAGATYRDDMQGTIRFIHTLSVATDIADQATWLRRIKPDVVMGYPNALALVGEFLAASGAERCFKLVVCMGEVANAQAREKIERTFGCPTIDVYSGSEFGTVAVEDMALRRFFVSEETIFVEFRTLEGLSFSNDNVAELIFTPLYNYAMPLVRYATGDFAEIDRSPPPDERGLRRLRRVLGRQRNIFVLPSGRRWWPTYTYQEIRKFLDAEQIQIAQTASARIEVRFVANNPAVKLAELLGYLQSATPETMTFELVRLDRIERRRSGKFEDMLCEIA